MITSFTKTDLYRFNLLWTWENLVGRHLDKRRGALATWEAKLQAAAPSPRLQEIERLDTLDLKRFERDYYRKARPVVFTGAARDWACVRRWSPDWLAEHYGDRPVDVG